MSDRSSIWVEKYRPKTLDEYIFHDQNQKLVISKSIEDKEIEHMLFSGVQGSGKTTLAFIIVDALSIDPLDVLTINSSDETGVDTMRDKIKSFISTYALGKYKIVHLEEADHLSLAAQTALRRMMEEYSDSARFILTCNYPHKIIPPLRSRLEEFRFVKHDIDDVTEMVAGVLIKEKIKFDLDLLDKYVQVAYPDIRKIINMCQQYSKTGVLLPLQNADGSGEYKLKLLEYIETDDWVSARTLLCSSVIAEEWEEVYRFLYQSIHKAPKFSNQSNWETAIVAIADHLYKHAVIADPEINAAALFIRLGQIKKQ